MPTVLCVARRKREAARQREKMARAVIGLVIFLGLVLTLGRRLSAGCSRRLGIAYLLGWL